MNTPTLTYKRQLTPLFFAGASHEDMKWTINYLIGLLEMPDTREAKYSRMTISEAKAFLSQRKLKSHNVPADFNGMRDEVNPKYL